MLSIHDFIARINLDAHQAAGLLGFFATKAAGFNERTCRTVAIETAMCPGVREVSKRIRLAQFLLVILWLVTASGVES